MAELQEIVQVNIDLQTTPITRVGFGTPLLLTEHANFSERTKVVASLTEVTDLGFATTDEAYKMMAAVLSQEFPPRTIKLGRKASGESWTDAINAVLTEDSDWYGLAAETRLEADINAIATVIEASSNKIYIAATADAGVPDSATTDDVGSDNKDAARRRTGVIYLTNAATLYPDAAWLGEQLPKDPGSSSWKFKTLNGITVDTGLTAAQRTTLRNKRVNFYNVVAGRNITQEGIMGDGNYIDIIRGVDWMSQRMEEDIFKALVDAEKVPYTNAGLAVIEAVMRKRLDIGVRRGVVAPEPAYTVNIPDVLDIDSNDRASRVVRDITFEYRAAGAIHEMIIKGTVTA